MKRPFAVIGFSYLAAQAVALLFGFSFSLAVLAAAIVALAVYCLLLNKRSKLVLAVLSCVAIANAVYCAYDWTCVRPMSQLEGTTAYITGTVSQDPYEENGRFYYTVKSKTNINDSTKHGFTCRISSKTKLDARVSDEISAQIVFTKSAESVGFSSRSALLARGVTITGFITSDSSVVVTKKDGGLKRAMSDIRNTLALAVDGILSPETSPLLLTMLLGDKSQISSGTAADFRICGLSHLLVVSGLHLSILVTTISFLLHYIRVKHLIVNIVEIGFIIFYMALTGFGASIIRSGIMMILLILADILERETDPLNSLGVAVTAICLTSPVAVADCSFILSVFSTMGIIVLFTPINKRLAARLIKDRKSRFGKICGGIVATLSVNLSATVFVLPFTLLYFGTVSLISPISNLLCIMPATYFIIIGAMATLLYLIPVIGPFLAYVPSIIAWLIGRLLILETKVLAAIPNAGVSVNYDFLPAFCVGGILLFAILAFLFAKAKSNKTAAAVLCAALCMQAFLGGAAFGKISSFGKSTATVYNVEDGLAVSLSTKGRTVLIGAGGDRYLTWLMTVDLEDRNIQNIDALFLPALDKYSGASAAEIIEEFDPQSVFSPNFGKYDYEVFTAAKDNRCKVYDISNCSYVDEANDIAVKSFTDSTGNVWIYAECSDLSLLVCPPKGDCLMIPSDMRTADVVIVSTGKQINASYLSAQVFVVSANPSDCAQAKLILEYRNIENVFTTDEYGGLTINEKNGKLVIGGVGIAGY